MKKIGVDARLYSQTGIGTYIKNLLFYLDKKDFKGELIYVYLMSEDFEKFKPTNKNIIKRQVNFSWHSFSEQFWFSIKLYKDNLDLMHFTYFSYPVLYFKKFIATVHDATPLLFKTGKASTKNQFVYQIKHLLFRLILWCQVNRAMKIITPTITVKKQLENIYGKKISNKITPIYEGVNYQIRESNENKELSKKFNNFFIYVGNFYPHKNVESLIEAFSKVQTVSKLLLIGPNDFFKNRVLQSINRLKQDRRILFVNNLTVEDLTYFYKNARALIHPSLSEGFGLPLVEAAYFDCPIIASDIEVFKELLENNYLSFNPNDAKDISKKINKFIKEKPKYDYKNIMNKFSFEKMTDETLKIYIDSLNGN